MSFDSLPVELYESIFGFLTPQELPGTVLAVSRAIPLSPVPLHHLYHDIRLNRPDQAIKLYQHLRHVQNKLDGDPSYLDLIASWINQISIESWDVDAEVMINLFRLLGLSISNLQLRSLNIWIGPRNFAPEHLEKLFIEPLPSLQYLSLRFKPYVQKATYQQFLKGTYFDSTLKAIASWPSATLPALSVIQDPIDAAIFSETRSFAQPLVFFRLDLATFIRSPALSSLKSLRFRIPARPVARTLCTTQGPRNHLNDAQLPDLSFLDLSTSGILEAEIDLLFVRLPQLEHLILDGCSLSLSGDIHDGEWHALGKRLALIGAQRAREREKTLKEWLELRELSREVGSVGIAGSDPLEGKKIRPGRRGLATATISFRTPDPVVPSHIPQQRPPSVGTSNKVFPTPSTTLPTTPETSQNLSPQASTSKDGTSEKESPSKPTSTKTPVSKSTGVPNTPASAPRLDIKLRYEPPKSKKKKKSVTIAPKAPSPPPPPLPPPPPPPPPELVPLENTETQPDLKGKGKHKTSEQKTSDKKKKDVKKRTSTKIRVLPSPPSLLSLSLSLSSSVLANRQPGIRREFEKGWLEGIVQLEGTQARLRISAGNGVRIMRLPSGSITKLPPLPNESDGDGDGNSSESSMVSTGGNKWAGGLVGLEDVDLTDPDTFGMNRGGVESARLAVPVLCFAGPGKNGEHVDNCGHSVAWEVMKDDH